VQFGAAVSTKREARSADPEASPGGDYTIRITTEDDTEGHFLSVVRASEGHLQVASRDGCAYGSRSHDVDDGQVFKAIPEDADDVARHAMRQREWGVEIEGEDDVEGHGLSRSDVALAALAASTAVMAMLNSAGGEAAVHLARI